MGGVRKWQFLVIYSTVNHHRSEWVGQKSQKHDDIILDPKKIGNVEMTPQNRTLDDKI